MLGKASNSKLASNRFKLPGKVWLPPLQFFAPICWLWHWLRLWYAAPGFSNSYVNGRSSEPALQHTPCTGQDSQKLSTYCSYRIERRRILVNSNRWL